MNFFRINKNIIGKASRSFSYILLLSVFVFANLLTISVQSAYAQDSQQKNCYEDFINSNTIQYYDPCAGEASSCSVGGSLTGPAPTQLSGETNADKVWNYFRARGLSPVAAAGAMGNVEQESSFDPFIVEASSGRGFGLIQWTDTDGSPRRTNLENAASAAGISFTKSEANNDPALLFQLNYLWDGEYKKQTWQEPVNAETTVDGTASIPYTADNTGNGSAMLFHSLVERSGDNTAQKQERIDSAKSFLEKYGGGGATGQNCGAITEGGLTLEQAKEFMKRYGENVNGYSAKMSGTLWGMCNGGGSNCVTFSYFFNHAFTDLPAAPGDGNGEAIVNSLRGKGANGGDKPQVWSTFSWSGGDYGHTGIVLGIHGDDIIVGHASCSNKGIGKGDGTYEGGGSGFVKVGKLSDNSAFWGTTPSGFAYPNNVDTAKISQFISQGYVNE